VCDCGDSTVTVTVISGDTKMARTTSTCAGITVELLNLWISQVQCAVGRHQLIGESEKRISNALEILQNYKAYKQVEPEGCDYFEYVPLFQQLIVKIVEEGLCN
jgi:hypothetical protein